MSGGEHIQGLFNTLTVAGALLLWAGFFLLGVIARRYETVFRKGTGWRSLMMAPSGILVYVLLVVLRLAPGPSEKGEFWETFAYVCLLVSAGFTLYTVERFHRLVRRLTSEQAEGVR